MRNSIYFLSLFFAASFASKAMHIEFIPAYDPEIVQNVHLRVSFRGMSSPTEFSEGREVSVSKASLLDVGEIRLGSPGSIPLGVQVLGRTSALYVVRDWVKESANAHQLFQNWERYRGERECVVSSERVRPAVAATGGRQRSNSQTHLTVKRASCTAAVPQAPSVLTKPSARAMCAEEKLGAWERETGADRHHIFRQRRLASLQNHLLKYKGDSEEEFAEQVEGELRHILHNHLPYAMIADALKYILYAYYAVKVDPWKPEEFTDEMVHSEVAQELRAYFIHQAQYQAGEKEAPPVLLNPHSIRAQRYFNYFLYEIGKIYSEEEQQSWALRNLRDHISSSEWWRHTFSFLPLLYDAPHIIPEGWAQLVQTGKLMPKGYALFKLPAEERKDLSELDMVQLRRFEERYRRPLADLVRKTFVHLASAQFSHWEGEALDVLTLPLLHKPILVQLLPVGGERAPSSLSIEIEGISAYIQKSMRSKGEGYVLAQGELPSSERAGKEPLIKWDIPLAMFRDASMCGPLASIRVMFDGKRFSFEGPSSL